MLSALLHSTHTGHSCTSICCYSTTNYTAAPWQHSSRILQLDVNEKRVLHFPCLPACMTAELTGYLSNPQNDAGLKQTAAMKVSCQENQLTHFLLVRGMNPSSGLVVT